LLLLLLLLLCVTERKSLTDVVCSTGQHTKKRGPLERAFRLNRERFLCFPSFFFFFGFLIRLTLFLSSSFSTRRGYYVNSSSSYGLLVVRKEYHG